MAYTATILARVPLSEQLEIPICLVDTENKMPKIQLSIVVDKSSTEAEIENKAVEIANQFTELVGPKLEIIDGNIVLN